VAVLTIYWEEDEYEGAKSHAEQVERVSKNSYNYGIVLFPYSKKHKNVTAELFIKSTDITGNLDKKIESSYQLLRPRAFWELGRASLAAK